MSTVYPENVRLREDGLAVRILDQTLLPNEEVYRELTEPEEMWDAIYSLRVRGAPCIGIFAAYAVFVLCRRGNFSDRKKLEEYFQKQKTYLDSSRPTAVNLRKMLDRMENVFSENPGAGCEELLSAMRREAERIHREDEEMCRKISEYGLTLVKDGDGVLTHCNAGPLATSRYGTGQGTFFLAAERGIRLKAYCDETRPLLQGARLTSFELSRAGVDTTLICDNMASLVMKQGKIQACFAGCDRLAMNGDAANKIGTSGVAVLAKYYGIPFYIFCPGSTVDPNCETGADIPIEERKPEEIKTLFFEKPTAPAEVKCYNPSFDVTDHSLITAIVTEKGIVYPPFGANLRKLFGGGTL